MDSACGNGMLLGVRQVNWVRNMDPIYRRHLWAKVANCGLSGTSVVYRKMVAGYMSQGTQGMHQWRTKVTTNARVNELLQSTTGRGKFLRLMPLVGRYLNYVPLLDHGSTYVFDVSRSTLTTCKFPVTRHVYASSAFKLPVETPLHLTYPRPINNLPCGPA